jgi:hypothetical protein
VVEKVDYTEIVTEAGAVKSLCILVTHTNRDIQKEACWTLSNIAAGTVSQIQRVLDSGIMLNIVQLARSADTDPEVSYSSASFYTHVRYKFSLSLLLAGWLAGVVWSAGEERGILGGTECLQLWERRPNRADGCQWVNNRVSL